jgi:hypothetical protein
MTPIRVGLLLDGSGSPLWVQQLISQLRNEEGVELVAAIRKAGPAKPSGPKPLLYRAWCALDRRLFPVSPDAFQPVDLTAQLQDVPCLEVQTTLTNGLDGVSDSDLARIKACGPDVLLKLGFGGLSGGIFECAPWGVWALDPGDSGGDDRNPAGLWEVLLQRPTTESALVRLAADPTRSRVLYRSWSTTHKFSPHRNQNALAWKGLAFFARTLRRMRSGSAPEAPSGAPEFSEQVRRPIPSNGILLRRLTPLAWGLLKRLVWKVFCTEQWMLLYAWGSPDAPLGALARYRKLVPPRYRFWADPIVVEENGKHVLFLEENENRLGKAHLSVLEFGPDGEPLFPPRKILEKPTHLSYPFVFKDEGTWYMIPESRGTTCIELYQCTGFPDRWEFVMNLMEGVAAVDATLWKHEGRFWMFVNLSERKGVSTWDELFLYSAQALRTTDWTPHPLNPIVSDVRRARPAGPIFLHKGQWFRPSQDCGGDYGMAVVFNRIERISTQDYAETPIGRLEAAWDPEIIRTHTYSRAGRLTFLDGLMKRRRWGSDTTEHPG